MVPVWQRGRQPQLLPYEGALRVWWTYKQVM